MEGEILGVHEAATKLWQTFLNKPLDKDHLAERLSNILIGVVAVSGKLGITDFESHLENRIKNLEKEIE